jgi:hypothetical protein
MVEQFGNFTDVISPVMFELLVNGTPSWLTMTALQLATLPRDW